MLANIPLFIYLAAVFAVSGYIIYLYLKTQRLIHRYKASEEEKLIKMGNLSKQIETLEAQVDAQKKQLEASVLDPVTALVSFPIFEDRLRQAIQESARYQFKIGVMNVDINDFSMIQDALGTKKANLLLKEIGKRIKHCIRNVDTVTRYRNDTFHVLLLQLSKPETAAIVAQRIIQSLKEPFFMLDEEISINCRIGIAIHPADGEDMNELLKNAANAQKAAKLKDVNVYQFYQQDMQVKSHREIAMHTSLYREKLFQELVVYFQPIMNVQNQQYFALEALLHWHHPELGLVPPGELYNYAHKHHKENLLSEWALTYSCKEFLQLESKNQAPQYLALPFSIKQLDSVHFIYRISKILQDSKFNAEKLLIEVNEGAAQLPVDVLQKAFNMLKYLGVKIAINRFATEPFSISRLQYMHVDYLKVSSSLMKNINQNEHAKKLFLATLEFAKQMDMTVIFDDVDDEQSSLDLRELGCYLQQGRFIKAAKARTTIAKEPAT